MYTSTWNAANLYGSLTSFLMGILLSPVAVLQNFIARYSVRTGTLRRATISSISHYFFLQAETVCGLTKQQKKTLRILDNSQISLVEGINSIASVQFSVLLI